MPGHGLKGSNSSLVMVLFVDGHVGGPYSYNNDFEDYNVNTSKPVIWDPNGTSDWYD